jgi:hypothetical protein
VTQQWWLAAASIFSVSIKKLLPADRLAALRRDLKRLAEQGYDECMAQNLRDPYRTIGIPDKQRSAEYLVTCYDAGIPPTEAGYRSYVGADQAEAQAFLSAMLRRVLTDPELSARYQIWTLLQRVSSIESTLRAHARHSQGLSDAMKDLSQIVDEERSIWDEHIAGLKSLTEGDFARYLFNLRPFRAPRNDLDFMAEYVHFFGRDDKLESLIEFCDSAPTLAWWSVTGKGGTGKSRLAYELCNEMGKRKWACFFLPASFWVGLATQITNWEYPDDVLLVVDYVASHSQAIGSWLVDLARRGRGHRLRVLLLERDGFGAAEPSWFTSLYENEHPDDVLATLYSQEERGIDLNSPMDFDAMVQIARSASLERSPNNGTPSRKPSDLEPAISESVARTLCMHLEVIDPEGKRPLYLLFLIRAWLESPDSLAWKHRWSLNDLLSVCFERETKLLRNELAAAQFRPVATDVALDLWAFATASGAIEDLDMEENPYVRDLLRLVSVDRRSEFVDLIVAHCGSSEADVEPLMPDIPGEYLVLKRLSRWQRSNDEAQVRRFLEGAFSSVLRELFWTDARARLTNDFAETDEFSWLLASEGGGLLVIPTSDDGTPMARANCHHVGLGADLFVARLAQAPSAIDLVDVLEDFKADLMLEPDGRDAGAGLESWEPSTMDFILGTPTRSNRLLELLAGQKGSLQADIVWSEIVILWLAKMKEPTRGLLGLAYKSLPDNDRTPEGNHDYALRRYMVIGMGLLAKQISVDQSEPPNLSPLVKVAATTCDVDFSNGSCLPAHWVSDFLALPWLPEKGIRSSRLGVVFGNTNGEHLRDTAPMVVLMGLLEHQNHRVWVVQPRLDACERNLGSEHPLTNALKELLMWAAEMDESENAG